MACAQDNDLKIQQLEKQLAELANEVQQLKQQKEKSKQSQDKYNQEVEELKENLRAMEYRKPPISFDKFTFGGYGEIHANFKENSM